MSEQEQETPKIHFTAITDTLFDALLASGVSSLAIAICLYILRHTEGWQQDTVALSADEFMHGRRKSNRERYDAGLPIKHHMTLAAGIEELGKAGFIFEIDTRHHLGIKSYCINRRFRERNPEQVAALKVEQRYKVRQEGKEFFFINEEKPRQKATRAKAQKRKPSQKVTTTTSKNSKVSR